MDGLRHPGRIQIETAARGENGLIRSECRNLQTLQYSDCIVSGVVAALVDASTRTALGGSAQRLL